MTTTDETTTEGAARHEAATDETTDEKGITMDETIRTVLAEHGKLAVDVATIDEHTDLFASGMTSHASVNVMLALEDAFDIEFSESMLKKSTFESIAAIRAGVLEMTNS